MPGFGDDDGDERLGAHRRRGQPLPQVIVDLASKARTAAAAVPGDPQVPFGAVVGNGSHHEQQLIDQLGP